MRCTAVPDAAPPPNIGTDIRRTDTHNALYTTLAHACINQESSLCEPLRLLSAITFLC